MDDTKVIEEIQHGNHDAFSIIMDRYHNELFKYIYKITVNYDTTEDLLQDFFMLLYSKVNMYKSDLSSFRTWMYRLVSNFMISYLRKREVEYFNVESENDFDYLTDSSEDTEELIIKEEQMKNIVNIMNKVLKTKQLNIMTLHYFSGLTVKEISESLKIPLKTIYKSIKSSVEKIRKEVDLYEQT